MLVSQALPAGQDILVLLGNQDGLDYLVTQDFLVSQDGLDYQV